MDMASIKAKTKSGSGCGGCVPLVTSIFNAEMKKAGHTVLNQYASLPNRTGCTDTPAFVLISKCLEKIFSK